MRNKLTFAMLALTIVSCASLRSQHDPVVTGVKNDSGPEIHDVPFQARQGDYGPRKRLIVLPFLDATGMTHSDRVVKAARDALVRSLNKTDAYVIVSNTDFPKDVSSFVKNGDYDLEEMAKYGLNIGVAGVIDGRIIEVKTKKMGDEVGLVREVHAQLNITVQLRMVATKSAHVVVNDMRSTTLEDSTTHVAERNFSDRELADDPIMIQSGVIRAFDSILPKIASALEKLSWEGRVALVKGERIFVNAGRISGLQVGDILKVMEEGEDVFDPETGALIGKVPGRVKGTLEVVSYFGKDGSVGVLHSGGGFKENDLVELY